MSDRRIEVTISRTAEWTCVSRAASSLESDSYYRSADHIALLLVPAFLQRLLRITWFRRFYSRVLAPKGGYEYIIARTKYIDAVFQEALGQGVEQILIFGAGFDTRAVRLKTETGVTRVFELDVPLTQQSKLEQYAKRGVPIPPNVTFIAIDFDKEVLADKLLAAGFREGMPSLFILEGLLMYLQPQSVEETFKVIAAFAGEGSLVVFDYVHTAVLQQAGNYYGQEEIVKSVTKAGEYWHFGLEKDTLAEFLNKYGFSVTEHQDAQDLERRYFTTPVGETVGRINGTHCLVKATKSTLQAQIGR